MATGSGKSVVIAKLAFEAFPLLNDDEHIVIVTPHIRIMTQLWHSLVRCHESWGETRFPFSRIVTVSSMTSSIHLPLLKMNQSMKQRSIMIICESSFSKILADEDKTYDEYLTKSPLILFDEYHAYSTKICQFHARSDEFGYDKIKLGFSASKPEINPFSKPVYNYPLAQGIQAGYLAPIMMETFHRGYSEDAVNELIDCLPLMLQHANHPEKGVGKLQAAKGIIYLPTIDHCKRLAEKLSGVVNFTLIHTGSTQHKEDFQAIQSNHLLIVCRMLTFGYDDPWIRYTIIARDLSNTDLQNQRQTLLQMMGRGSRLLPGEDKVNYVLTFSSNVCNIYKQLIDPRVIKLDFIDNAFSSNGVYYKNESGGFTVNNERFYEYLPHDASFMISPDFLGRLNNYYSAFDEEQETATASHMTTTASQRFFRAQNSATFDCSSSSQRPRLL